MKSPLNSQVQAPRFPADLPSGDLRALDDESEYGPMVSEDAVLGDASALRIAFEGVLLRRASLTRARLPNARISDTRFEASDLSGASLQKARCHRVEFIGCRLTGMQLFEFNGADLLFVNCMMENAMFTSGRLRSARFEKCALRGALMEKMDLTGAVFQGCDLSGADFPGTTLKGVDLRGSDLAGMRVEGRQLKGIIIDSVQAIQIAALLGIIVKDTGE